MPKFIWKITKILVFTFVMVFFIVLSFLHIVRPYISPNEKETADYFIQSGIDYISHYDSLQNETYHYISMGNDTAGHLYFFLHGAPGSWKDYSVFFESKSLLDSAIVIVMDRPGYGQSTYGRANQSILTQAKMCKQVLQNYPNRKTTLIGYSYGGPVAAVLAGMMNDQISKTILLAPVIHPEKEKIFWFNHLINFPPIYYLMPGYIKSSNDEKLGHAEALRVSSHYLDSIGSPILHIHSTDDWIAPYEENTIYLKKKISNTYYKHVQWQDKSHFLPNDEVEEILPFLRTR